jgi:hypothetical protein
VTGISGAATTDDCSITSHINSNASGWIFFGWYKPTTLTAGRAYWGASTLTHIKVATTTSELAIARDRATTDSLHTTSGAAITVGEWHFIAIAKSSTGGASAIRCWIGHGSNAPQEVTVNVTTAGAGAETAASPACVGNDSVSGSVAFEGEVGQVGDGRFTVSPTSPLCNATAGTITQAEADYYLQTVVIPYWAGEPRPGFAGSGTGSVNSAFYLFDIEECQPVMWIVQNGATQRIGPEVLNFNGWTLAETRQGQRPLQSYPQRSIQYVRR